MPKLSTLDAGDIAVVKDFFRSVFTVEPWNDDWSDETQLHVYITDLMGNPNSLSYGLYENDTLVGIALGSIKHWYAGTEYYVDEFCVKTDLQGCGLGTAFLTLMTEEIRKQGIVSIFLQTERNVPAYRFYLKNGFAEMTEHVSLSKSI